MLVFGTCGYLICNEILKMKINDVEDLGDRFLVTVLANKNDYSGQFIIRNMFYAQIKKYINLRRENSNTNRFFIHYTKGKCSNQPIGIHSIGQVPRYIAEYLQLPNADSYTGHCFRRTPAKLASDSGATMQMIKQLGRWRSDAIAEAYIENSLYNRQLIYNKVTQHQYISNSCNPQFNAPDLVQMPSTSTMTYEPIYNHQQPTLISSIPQFQIPGVVSVPAPTANENSTHSNEGLEPRTSTPTNDENYEINWADFEEDFEQPASNKDTNK